MMLIIPHLPNYAFAQLRYYSEDYLCVTLSATKGIGVGGVLWCPTTPRFFAMLRMTRPSLIIRKNDF